MALHLSSAGAISAIETVKEFGIFQFIFNAGLGFDKYRYMWGVFATV
jgi:hypothetical protein